MAATQHIFALAFCACLVATFAAPPAAAKAGSVVFNAKNIVANVTTDCPVKSVAFAKSEFDVDELPSLLEVLQKGQVSSKCQEEAMSLMGCYNDGSLAIKTGCCAKECAQSIEKSIDSGCFSAYAKAICNDKDAKKKFLAGLTNAGTRCANYQGTCEEILAGGAPKKGNATADADAKESPAAKDAAAPAAKDAPAPKKSSAVRAAAAALLPFAAAAAAILVV